MGKSSSAGAKGAHPADKKQRDAEELALSENMGRIRKKLLVMSGKGGVGKSTVATELAFGLSGLGKATGLLDVDVHGPSVPHLLGLTGDAPEQADGRILPIECDGLKVMSIGFFLQTRETPVIWRGPLKTGMIRQFLRDVAWGELDYLVIDCPPGTGDEPLSVAQMIPDAVGAVMVTTSQEVALADVRRAISFCRQLKLPVLGVIENMSGVICPKCGERIELFGSGGGERMSVEMGVTFLGAVPFDPELLRAADEGRMAAVVSAGTGTQEAFARISRRLLDL